MSDSLKIAAIGDSLTQGFMSGAISRTEISYPTLIAGALGLRVPEEFRVPRFPGPGLPLNLEDCLRSIERSLGPDIQGFLNWSFRFPREFADFADQVEDLYERGRGSRRTSSGGVFHNLAVWGYRVQDSFALTPNVCREAIESEEGFVKDDFLGLPSGALYRTAIRVLNPRHSAAKDEATQISELKALVDTEGLDVLILFLGSNDCLGTVLSLEVNDMQEHDGSITDDPIQRRKLWNLTSKKQFKKDYKTLVSKIREVIPRSTKVFVGNVPHVTIPPVSRGVGRFENGYFDHYARFFMDGGDFSRFLHSHLTREQAIAIDKRIDSFNETIKAAVGEEGWHLVDICSALDQLAVRRNGFGENPQGALVEYYAEQGISDHPLLNLDPVPSILMLKTRELGNRIGGGLFSLDGVHPSTIGYGIIAELFLSRMKEEGVEDADPRRLNWRQIIAQDSLLNRAPRVWDDVTEVTQDNPLIWDTLFSLMG